MADRTVPPTVPDDDDDVVVALETARVSEERDDLEAASKWLHRAAAAARRQGRPERAGTLSRCAAHVLGTEHFEKKPDQEQLFREIEEDDFDESTIVETAEQIAKKDRPQVPNPPTEPVIVEKSTSKVSEAASGQPIRVAVRALSGQRLETRRLSDTDTLKVGEYEALLVPVGDSGPQS